MKNLGNDVATMVKAGPKQGKTTLLLNEAVNKALQGIPTLVIDTEMSDRRYTERLISRFSDLSAQKAMEIIKSLPLIHLYLPEVDKEALYEQCKHLKQSWNLGFIAFDYIKPEEEEKMSDFLENRIAKDLGITVLGACGVPFLSA